MTRLAFFVLCCTPWALEAKRTNHVARVEPNGVGCAELQNIDTEAGLVEKIPGEVQKILTAKELDDEYLDLVNDLLVARKGRAGTWKGSALYRTMVLRGHMDKFEAKNIALYLTKDESKGWFSVVSTFKVCLVDRSKQPNYEPAGVYKDSSNKVDIGYGEEELHQLPEGVLGVVFEGTLDSNLATMPVNIMRLLSEKDLLLEHSKLAAMINTAEADSLWTAYMFSDYAESFRNKGVGLFFNGFNALGGISPAAGRWNEKECPEGTMMVKSAQICSKLAFVNGNEYEGSRDTTYYPPGCYFKRRWTSDTSFTIEFNSYANGRATTYAAPMCQKLINYEDSLNQDNVMFRYWVEYADLSKTGDSYVPKLKFSKTGESGLDVSYPMGRVSAYKKCLDGDSTELAEVVHKASGQERSGCGGVAGASGRDSKAYPACKCAGDNMEVYCGNTLVAGRKFDIATVLTIKGCTTTTAYCAKYKCQIPKKSSEL